jgi:hypothetical protein
MNLALEQHRDSGAKDAFFQRMGLWERNNH